jgi:hypothetical protein
MSGCHEDNFQLYNPQSARRGKAGWNQDQAQPLQTAQS